jgi:hypothetical protein
VIATSGDSRLGGDDFDNVIVQWLVDQYALTDKEGAKDLLSKPMVVSRLREAAEAAKLKLSTEQEVIISIPFIQGERSLECRLTRRRFESLSKELITRLMKPLREVALMSGINLPGESGQLGIDEDMYDESLDEMPAAAVSQLSGKQLESGAAATAAAAGGGGFVGPTTGSKTEVGMSVSELKRMQTEGRRLAKIEKKVKGSTTKELRRLQKELKDSTLAAFPGGQVRY